MGSLKKLAGQTMWYGVSNIAARLLTYLLTPYFTYTLASAEGKVAYGHYGLIYAIFPLLNVLYTYGMETSYFRFSTTENKKALYDTQVTSILLTTLLFTAALIVFRYPVADYLEFGGNIEYVGLFAAIVAFDTLSALPYARLRQENRPRKYAFTKVAGIIVFVGVIVFLFSFGDDIARRNEGSLFAAWYNRYWGIGFILFANVLQAIITLLLLSKELFTARFTINGEMYKKVLAYGLPILITGFAGVINESLNRAMFKELYPAPAKVALRELGYFTATLRLATMMYLVIQAFKLAAEPFFFSISKDNDAQHTYARVMKWFVIIMALMFLNVVLYMDLWKLFLGSQYRVSLELVPILLMSYLFLGVYYNLTVWYKLTDKTMYGMYITIIGAVVTVAINWAFIPTYSYAACAWGMLACYGTMMLLSYLWGQKHYPIPYQVKKIGLYLLLMLALFAVQAGISTYSGADNTALRLTTGTILFALFLLFIFRQEKQELKSFPFIGRMIK